MSSPFLAEIRAFGFDFAPKGWATCDGQLLPLSQNTALFSLLGTIYGGNGKTNFALPDLQGSAALGQGGGPATSEYFLGQQSGSAAITLLQSEIPVHTHAMRDHDIDLGEANTPSPQRTLAKSANSSIYVAPGALTMMHPQALAPSGGSLSHNNMMPYLTLNFCIALQGIFPPRP